MKSLNAFILMTFVWSGLAHAIILGEDVTSDNPLSKMVVNIEFDTKLGKSSCTGTLVAQNVVLTAAHCIDGSRDLVVRFPFSGLERTVGAAETRIHERYNTDEGGQKYQEGIRGNSDYDIGLIRLEKAAPSDYKVVRLDFVPLLQQYEKVVIAGFGGNKIKVTHVDREFDRIEGIGAGKLRWGTSSLVRIYYGRQYDESGVLQGIQSEFEVGAHDGPEPNLGPGDSGGPIFEMKNGELIEFSITRGPMTEGTFYGKGYAGTLGFAFHKRWIERAISELSKKPN
jgi:V8-like Glu-specific endopeptidase